LLLWRVYIQQGFFVPFLGAGRDIVSAFVVVFRSLVAALFHFDRCYSPSASAFVVVFRSPVATPFDYSLHFP
jgi:hypothetical protein